MTLAERILLALSRPVGSKDYGSDCRCSTDGDSALSRLESAFPEFRDRIKGKRVLDLGCGEGYQVVAMAENGAASAIGIDPHFPSLARAQALLERHRPPVPVHFFPTADASLQNSVDIVISQNSFEHIPEPVAALESMKRLLVPGGLVMITFCPPWYAPYGAHMHFFTKVPWVNLLFSERTVMTVRSRFRADAARRYEDVEMGLNRMSIRKFERIVAASGMTVAWRRYVCVKKMDFLSRVPLARELFINVASCVLVKS